MAPEKVTEMILNVDLKCSGCYKKVKKVICKIPQIRDQVFDVDKNKVRIMVVCCSPEKIRNKLCYKGGGAIQSIEIVEKAEKPKPADDKPKDGEKPKTTAAAADKPKAAAPAADKPKAAAPAADKPKDVGKPKDADKPKPADKPKEGEKPKAVDKPKDSGKPADPEKAKPKDGEKPKGGDKPSPPKEAPKEAPKKADAGPNPEVAKMVYEPVHGYPQMCPPSGYPMVGYGQYYDHGYGGGYGGAPYQHGYGMPIAPPPPPSYGGFGYDNGYNGYNGNRSHEEEEGCSIM